ncbi:DUF2917 domain-containing protein [Geomonas sp. RF6]|uniref:DUF2917 domain-containing protein n=1 Tax=Geomonas sp. RF6 TaxID=2897342 RepID=UPI001E483F24|nr:DUF2917 domain-containing protein [Geomonas sp. RF6]UFS70112.1 DUF2917 domain-containing protein [Geomonas sp. RF6]
MEIGLDDGAVLGIDGNKEVRALRCLAGCLYLTRSGDPCDYVLTPGEQIEVTAREHIVVEAWGDARLKCIAAAAMPHRKPAEVWHLVGSA